MEKSVADGLFDVPVQSMNFQAQTKDQSNEAFSNAETQKPSALGLLALNYGNSSDSEDDQVDPTVSVFGDKNNETNCSLGSHQNENCSSTLQDCHGDASGPCGHSLSGLNSEAEHTSQNVDLCKENACIRDDIKDDSHQRLDSTVDLESNNLASKESNSLEGKFRDPMNVLHTCLSDSYDAETTKFGKPIAPVKNANMPFAPMCDEDSSRMHVFCLEHAVEVEQQLRQIGGVHVLLLCHPGGLFSYGILCFIHVFSISQSFFIL